METIYELPFQVRYCDVDAQGRLRLSTLFTLWQECGMAQMQTWGQGNGFTRKQGLLWIVSRQQAEVMRLPGMDEHTVLRTWAGDCRHGIWLRSYELSGHDGAVLVRGGAQWSLLHAESRTMEMRPGEYGVSLPGCVTGRELPRQKPLRSVTPEHTGAYTVPYSALDANGHMNNARYLDLAQDVLPCRGRAVRWVRMEYHREVLLDQTLRWGWTELPNPAPDTTQTAETAASPDTPQAAETAALPDTPQAAAPGRTYYFEAAVKGTPSFRLQLTCGAE